MIGFQTCVLHWTMKEAITSDYIIVTLLQDMLISSPRKRKLYYSTCGFTDEKLSHKVILTYIWFQHYMTCDKHVSIVFLILKKNIWFTTSSYFYYVFKVWQLNLFLLKMALLKTRHKFFFLQRRLINLTCNFIRLINI